MRSAELPIPGVLWGHYPERRGNGAGWLARRAARVANRVPPHAAFLRAVEALQPAMIRLSTEQCASEVHRVRQQFARRGLADDLQVAAFALFSEISNRQTGQRPYPGQMIAARAMLNRRLVEMPTGEGKTLAAALAAATAALARVPVHVITANEYLARRDADALRPIFGALGLDVGVVTQELDMDARRRAYRCAVTYCTAKELVFDYLRDSLLRRDVEGELRSRAYRMATPDAPATLLRGLCMAIVDEADSVLLDEASVPFVLSRAEDHRGKREHYTRALAFARSLITREDFVTDPESRAVELTAHGRAKAETQSTDGDTLWRVRRYREEALSMALAAIHLFHRDHHYLVRDGAVHIIDDTSGRVAPGRAWSRGLHQFIELKEGCRPSAELVTAAQITYQRFFSRYLHLCGMSGTLIESRAELRAVYGVPVLRVPLRQPSRRVVLPTRVFGTHKARWRFVVARARDIQARGGAALIGTDSVADSQVLSQHLGAAGLAHVVLNARQDRHEAHVIATAGQAGRITVATNMAGRGTDIAIAERLARAGGLHVMLCQANASRRIDRQFTGRCARRGEAGSCETLLSLESAPVVACLPAFITGWAGRAGELRLRWVGILLARVALWWEGRRRYRLRLQLRLQDEAFDREPMMGTSSR
ncbi:MAG: prepilin peptidase [Burkholderiales bacterium]|nr:prepilin peptidase [Burkholderiales bacterium]